jgi:hypothetical protein
MTPGLGSGLDGGSLSHRMSAAAATAALSHDGLPPVALWIAGRDDALPLALLLVRLMEAGHPPPLSVAATAAAAGAPRVWGSAGEERGLRAREEGSHKAGKAAAAEAAQRTLACSDEQWRDAVVLLVPALLAATRATDSGLASVQWQASALGLVERLVAAASPEALAPVSEHIPSHGERGLQVCAGGVSRNQRNQRSPRPLSHLTLNHSLPRRCRRRRGRRRSRRPSFRSRRRCC